MVDALEVHHLIGGFNTCPVLQDITLTVPENKLVAIIGPNGAGKSTFMKTVLQILPSLGGSIQVMGRKKKFQALCAYVPQYGNIEWEFPMTVEEFVGLGRYQKLGLWGRWSQQDREIVRRELERFSIDSLATHHIGALSVGQKQRISIARAFAQDAQIYFMDEPFAGIDAVSYGIIEKTLQEKQRQGKTLLIVHHDLGSVPALYDWVIILNKTLVAAGPIQEVFTQDNLAKAYGTTRMEWNLCG